jgi:hypothetical protein
MKLSLFKWTSLTRIAIKNSLEHLVLGQNEVILLET